MLYPYAAMIDRQPKIMTSVNVIFMLYSISEVEYKNEFLSRLGRPAEMVSGL